MRVSIKSYFPPVLFHSIVNPEKKYIIADGNWLEVPLQTDYKDVNWVKKVFKEQTAELPKKATDFQIPGSKGKTYLVRLSNNKYSCSCEAFTFSGGRSHCKHIKQAIESLNTKTER